MGYHFHVEIVLLLLFLAYIAEANAPMKVFNIMQFGAIANEETDSSKALLDAWNETCAWNGVGKIFIPQGTFLVGPVVLSGPCNGYIVFQMEGVVKATTDLNKYKSNGWIAFQYINGLLITGGGTFDGQGASAWPHNKCQNYSKCNLLPTSITLSIIQNARVHGISSINSKMFHINIFGSKNITFQYLTISSPAKSPNTDGIHIGSSSEIHILDSRIGTGDDCVSIGAGSYNISVSDVVCGPGHGISVGSLGKYPNEEDVRWVTVSNCTFVGTDNGARIKTWPDSPVASVAADLTFEDLVMKDVYNPIIIDQVYCPARTCKNESPSRVKIMNVGFKNIRGNSTSPVAVNFQCSKGVPCENVELIDIDLRYNRSVSVSSCSYVNGASYGKQIPRSCI